MPTAESPIYADMQPDDTLSLRGFSLQQEHLRHAARRRDPDAIDIQALLRWYYAEMMLGAYHRRSPTRLADRQTRATHHSPNCSATRLTRRPAWRTA